MLYVYVQLVWSYTVLVQVVVWIWFSTMNIGNHTIFFCVKVMSNGKIFVLPCWWKNPKRNPMRKGRITLPKDLQLCEHLLALLHHYHKHQNAIFPFQMSMMVHYPHQDYLITMLMIICLECLETLQTYLMLIIKI